MFFATVLILAGMQLSAVGLLAELQVRYYHDRLGGRPPYRVAGGRHFPRKNEEPIRR